MVFVSMDIAVSVCKVFDYLRPFTGLGGSFIRACTDPTAALTHVAVPDSEHEHTRTRPVSPCSAPPLPPARACRPSTRPWRTLIGVPDPPSNPPLFIASATITTAVAATALVALVIPRLRMAPPPPRRLRQLRTTPLPRQSQKLHRIER